MNHIEVAEMTNGDKIHSMNDRQLAESIKKNIICIDCPAVVYCGAGASEKPCIDIIEEWLKGDVEECLK